MKLHPAEIAIKDYDYPLPDDLIAKYPLPQRDQSRLLIYKQNKIYDSQFCDVADALPENALLVFNNTRVIRARLQFVKDTGARIEIFCLEPADTSVDYQLAFANKGSVEWRCLVGNSRRWKTGELQLTLMHPNGEVVLSAHRLRHDDEGSIIRFTWSDQELSFAEILELTGKIPLPPYLHREAEADDIIRYQTIYALNKGSVAAPTAGLHFTPAVMERLNKKNIQSLYVTLHVGAGTFKPVSSACVGEHEMHSEQIVIHRSTIETLRESLHRPVIPVGTTSVRSLESLYWFGAKLKRYGTHDFVVKQWDPYQEDLQEIAAVDALDAVLSFMQNHHLEVLTGHTRLLIAPGYQYRLVNGLITNFHQPQSTLLLLVSALIGPQWKAVYQHAMDSQYRFLSYGDSCLFLPC